MFRIWAKTITNHRVRKNEIYSFDERFDPESFWTYVSDICYKMGFATPVVLKTHLESFISFHTVKFRPSDFIDWVDFDELVLEDVSL